MGTQCPLCKIACKRGALNEVLFWYCEEHGVMREGNVISERFAKATMTEDQLFGIRWPDDLPSQKHLDALKRGVRIRQKK